MSLEFSVNAIILLATIVAIWFGPIRAVQVTRKLDDKRASDSRKYAILSDLMRTRQARLEPIHVGALNIIELEFHGCKPIIDSYRAYSEKLSSKFPEEYDEFQIFQQKLEDSFVDLLHNIAAELGYAFDKRDLMRLGYLPRALGDYSDDSRTNARYMRQVLEGTRAIPISNFISNDSLFPPVPDKKLLAKE